MQNGLVDVYAAGGIGPGLARRLLVNDEPLLTANVHDGGRFSEIAHEPVQEPATEALCTWNVSIIDDRVLVQTPEP